MLGTIRRRLAARQPVRMRLRGRASVRLDDGFEEGAGPASRSAHRRPQRDVQQGGHRRDGRSTGRVDEQDPEVRGAFREAIRTRMDWAPEEPDYHCFSVDVSGAGYVRFGDAAWRSPGTRNAVSAGSLRPVSSPPPCGAARTRPAVASPPHPRSGPSPRRPFRTRSPSDDALAPLVVQDRVACRDLRISRRPSTAARIGETEAPSATTSSPSSSARTSSVGSRPGTATAGCTREPNSVRLHAWRQVQPFAGAGHPTYIRRRSSSRWAGSPIER